MNAGFWIFLCAILTLLLFRMRQQRQELRRGEYIRSYMFPPKLLDAFARHRPELKLSDKQLVARALRQFFLAYLKSGRKYVAMPSQVVDELWHEFILYTRNYELFCRKAFGRFLHHTPAVVLGPQRDENTGLRRIWWFACLEENINPRHATRLPLLFAIDAKLKIGDGFHYELDCKNRMRKHDSGAPVYCVGDMSNSSFDGSTEGFGDSSVSYGASDGGGGDASGCGGGCGGGG